MKLLIILLYLTSESILSILASECCKDILLDDRTVNQALHKELGQRLGFYRQLGQHGDRPVYRQLNGRYSTFIYYIKEEQKWVDSLFLYGNSSLNQNQRLENNATSDCLEEKGSWSFYKKSKKESTQDLHVDCGKIEEVCCSRVRIDSSSSETMNADVTRSFGLYTAIGTLDGRYIYQMDGKDRFLEYWGAHWLVRTGEGSQNHGGIIRDDQGSVCPEQIIGGWKSDSGDGISWKDEPGITITCEGGLENSGSDSTPIILGIVLLVLLLVIASYFAFRIYKAWGRGARGKRILRETFLNRSFSVQPTEGKPVEYVPNSGHLTVPKMEGREFHRDDSGCYDA